MLERISIRSVSGEGRMKYGTSVKNRDGRRCFNWRHCRG